MGKQQELVWAAAAPTEHGWYWYRVRGVIWSEIVWVDYRDGVLYPAGGTIPAHRMPGEWAGPVPPPAEVCR